MTGTTKQKTHDGYSNERVCLHPVTPTLLPFVEQAVVGADGPAGEGLAAVARRGEVHGDGARRAAVVEAHAGPGDIDGAVPRAETASSTSTT